VTSESLKAKLHNFKELDNLLYPHGWRIQTEALNSLSKRFSGNQKTVLIIETLFYRTLSGEVEKKHQLNDTIANL
jgi:hypothetical protein